MRTALGIFLFAVLAAFAGLFFLSNLGEIREIDATTATSNCIGESTSALCAVDTWLACVARGNVSLCRTAVHGKRATAKCAGPMDYDDPTYELCNDLGLYEDVDASKTQARYRISDVRPLTDGEKSEESWFEEDYAPAPAYVVTVQRWKCLPQESETPNDLVLPIDLPGTSIGHRLRSLERRAQTIAWEYGVSKDPFPDVWYEVGADYCWEPLTYWVGEKDGEWRVVRWTTTGYVVCDSACGCPGFRWPPYRRSDHSACWEAYRKMRSE